MDWVTTTEDRSQTVASVKNAYEILRQKPPKLTQRLSKLAQRRSGKADDSDDEAKEEEPQQEDAPVLITGTTSHHPPMHACLCLPGA